ncbi:uncharacterized protein LOC124422065 [Vespa crabro]|uniref:uncharacterized protein LOC124422065 n=1 Tax=Vespa crabro TaxID=7445 RepID=UPI001F01D66A|nr:uncharacterized protein LOC124422065 [Vespa crabro]
MSSLMLVSKDQSIISESFRDTLMSVPRKETRHLLSEKKGRRKNKKTKIRKSIKDRSDVISDGDSRWDLYDEASTDEEMKRTEGEEEKEEKDLPSCPSSLTEDLNLSYDGKWLRKYMKIPLKMAFKEIIAKKPYDPVGYLGFWLLNYKKTLEDNRRSLELEEELYHLRCMMIKPREEVEEEASEVRTDDEEENIELDWNFQRYNNN